MEKIIVFGGGGHAKVIIDIAEKSGKFAVAAIVADRGSAAEDFGYPRMSESEAQALGVNLGVVAIGDNFKRRRLAEELLSRWPALRFATLIHPSAVLGKGVELGEGTVVMAGVVINPFTNVGAHCIFNTASSVDHDGQISDFASVAPGAVLGGGVSVGAGSAIGLGASVIHSRRIGTETIVGAGAVVLDDVPDFVVAYGNPCRVVRSRKEGESYLG